MTIRITKPLSKNFLCIRKETVNKAIKNNEPLEIITLQGKAIHNARTWKKTGKKMKKAFLYPDNPMVLYCNNIKYLSKEEQEREEYKKYLL